MIGQVGGSRPSFDSLTGLTNLGINMSLSSHLNDPSSLLPPEIPFPHNLNPPIYIHQAQHHVSSPSVSISLFSPQRISDLTAPSDLVMCRKQPGIAIGRLCDKCDGKCPVCDSYVRPTTLVRICDECSFGNYQNKCVVCGGEVSSVPCPVRKIFKGCILMFGSKGNLGRVLLL